MTAKEKSEKLFGKFLWEQRILDQLASRKLAIQCAILCVKEIMEAIPLVIENSSERAEWNEVLTELNKM